MLVRSREKSRHIQGHTIRVRDRVDEERSIESNREFKNMSMWPRSVDPMTGKSLVTRQAAMEGKWRQHRITRGSGAGWDSSVEVRVLRHFYEKIDGEGNEKGKAAV